MSTNITSEHRAVFEALTSGEYGNFALLSCFVNGEPAAAIVAVNGGCCPGSRPLADDHIITPLFVSVTDAMTLTDHDGRQPGGAA